MATGAEHTRLHALSDQLAALTLVTSTNTGVRRLRVLYMGTLRTWTHHIQMLRRLASIPGHRMAAPCFGALSCSKLHVLPVSN